LQVREYELIVVAGGEQVIGRRGEPDTSYVSGVGFEALHRPATPDVEEDAAAVLVSRDEEPPRRVDAEGRHGAANLQSEVQVSNTDITLHMIHG
jgi:hypothetical protein